jgi:L-alanine-DL-glutamate epimerase-like enolase superfamily enzyme
MKITRLTNQPYITPLNRLIGDANFPEGRRQLSGQVVRVATDEGLTGLGLGGSASSVANLAPVLIGADPRGVRGLWKRMADHLFKAGTVGESNSALSAIDMALWDVKAKAAGEPLWRMLGASEGRARAYASGIDMPLSDEDLRKFYEGMASCGIYAGKLKVGLDQDRDLRRLGIMQEALSKAGPRPALMVDSNEYWSPKQSIRKIREMEQSFDLTWVEEPARRWDFRGLRSVSESVSAAVATGENLDHPGQFMQLIDQRAVDVLNLSCGTGGITGMLMAADLAYAFELPVSVMNSPGNCMAHVAAALPNHMMMEVIDAGRGAFFDIDSRIEDGWVVLGDRPGLGIEIDEDKLAAMATPQPGPAIPGRRAGAGLVAVIPECWP